MSSSLAVAGVVRAPRAPSRAAAASRAVAWACAVHIATRLHQQWRDTRLAHANTFPLSPLASFGTSINDLSKMRQTVLSARTRGQCPTLDCTTASFEDLAAGPKCNHFRSTRQWRPLVALLSAPLNVGTNRPQAVLRGSGTLIQSLLLRHYQELGGLRMWVMV